MSRITGSNRLVVSLVAALVAFAAACEEPKNQEPLPNTPFGQQELLIGLIPEQNIFLQRTRHQFLGKYLSDRLGIAIHFTSLSRYGNIVDRFTAEKMDGAFFGSFTYALAHSQLSVEALARPVNLDGTSTYHGYIFVRKDSGIRVPADMKGKRFAFVERATTAGYLFPLSYFKKHGIADPHAFLGESFFTGSHDAAVLAVLNGDADIGAAKNTIYDQMAHDRPRVKQDLVILATSGVVPQNGLAVRNNLDPELKNALKEALIEMDKTAEGARVLRQFGAQGFVETRDEDYRHVYTLAAQVGVTLKSYRYRNR